MEVELQQIIRTTKSLDREMHFSGLQFELHCLNGNNGRRFTNTVDLTVLDEDDNDPFPDREPVEITIEGDKLTKVGRLVWQEKWS